MNKRKSSNKLLSAARKFFLSAFFVISFIAYALENHGTAVNSGAPVGGGIDPTPTGSASAGTGAASNTGSSSSADPSLAITAPTAAPTGRSGYRDGTYTGPVVDVNWGNVQVQATIQNGKINDVQFLQYPSDRRTSARINSFAVPVLKQEAIQVQSANVDLITGATLTSEGFQMSLQAALSQAKG